MKTTFKQFLMSQAGNIGNDEFHRWLSGISPDLLIDYADLWASELLDKELNK